MRKLQSILLATDFRPASEQAAKVAVQLAEVFGSHVTLFHVIEPLSTWPVLVHEYRDTATGHMREFAQKLTDQNVLVDESAITVGQPADSIVRKAEEIDADLILIGAGERPQFDHSLLGPTASAIVQHAAKPVLAVCPGEPVPKFGKILCPVDMSAVSARGLANAIQLTRAFGGHVVVLTVVPTANWLAMFAETGTFTEAAETHDRRWREEFDQFLTMCGIDGISWEKEVRTGHPHEEVIASAKAHQADLIVMGSTGRTGLARILIGSVTRRVMQQLPCSLLTVKQQNVLEELHDDEAQTISVLYAQGRALLEARSYEAALDKFTHVLVRNPFHAGALEGKAEILEKLGRPADAERCRRRAQVLRSEHVAEAV